MNNIDELKALINANIKRNGRQAITGNVLNGILNAMVDNLGDAIFLATYGTTTLAEIREADAEGMIVFCKNGSDILRLQSVNVNGARFVAIVINEGKYAICNNNGWTSGTFPISEVYFATYGVTSWDEILLMAQTRIVCCVYQSRLYLLSNPVDVSDPVPLVFTNIDGTILKTLNVTIAGAWSNSSINLQVLIANDLTTNDPTKALSAAQGVALKALIDALETQVAGKASQADLNALQQQVNEKAAQTDLVTLQGEVSQLGQEMGLLEIGEYDCAIVAYSYWQTGSDNKHYVIPVNGGSMLTGEGTGSLLSVCFLKSYTTPVAGETPDYCTGYSGRTTSHFPATLIIPNDCRYLIINKPSSAGVTSIKINGIEVLGGVYRSIADIGKSIDGAIKDTDITIDVVSNNLANPTGIIDGKLVGSNGAISSSSSWSMYRLPVTPGEQLTFGGFYLGRSGYYAFYNGDTLVSYSTYLDPDGVDVPVTVTVPTGANLLYFDIKSGSSPSNPYDYLQINSGATLKPYDTFSDVVTKILGKDLASNSTPDTIPDLIADLPTSADGTGIQTGYAYINSTTGAVVVKLS